LMRKGQSYFVRERKKDDSPKRRMGGKERERKRVKVIKKKGVILEKEHIMY